MQMRKPLDIEELRDYPVNGAWGGTTPKKNELLRMTAFILQSDDPEITPTFEQKIIEAHTALLGPGTCEPDLEGEKKANPT